MSPTLYNVLVDIIAERIKPNNEISESSGIILFADYVQFTAKSRLLLQINLYTAFTWATETEMTKKCVEMLHDATGE